MTTETLEPGTETPTPDNPPTDATTAPESTPLANGAFRVKIGGKEFTLRPAAFSDRDEKESMIRSLRPSLGVMLLEAESVPEQYRARAVDQIFEQAQQRLSLVTFEEEAAFDRSSTGVAWNFWKAARQHHPEIDSLEKARAVLDTLTRSEAITLLAALGLV